jgi:hypothetical protein
MNLTTTKKNRKKKKTILEQRTDFPFLYKNINLLHLTFETYAFLFYFFISSILQNSIMGCGGWISSFEYVIYCFFSIICQFLIKVHNTFFYVSNLV